MQFSDVVLMTLLSLPGASHGFAPNLPRSASPRASNTQIYMGNQNDKISHVLDTTKNGFLSIFAASIIFLSPSPILMNPAIAATPAVIETTTVKKATPTITTTTTASASKKSVDPLAVEKAGVETAKNQLSTATATTKAANKDVVAQTTVYDKLKAAESNAETKVVTAKKALITANDKLADAKAKEGMNGGNVSALKEVEALASKVGVAKDTLKKAEDDLKVEKAKATLEGKKLSQLEATLSTATKAESTAKSNLDKASKKLAVSQTKLAETQKKDAKKKAELEKKEKKDKAKADKIAKEKAQKAAIEKKKADKKAKKIAEKKAKEIAINEKKLKEILKADQDAINKTKKLESELARQKAQVEKLKSTK